VFGRCRPGIDMSGAGYTAYAERTFRNEKSTIKGWLAMTIWWVAGAWH
jgi:hypothetical protein